jgi:hypothetical protein
MKIRPPAAVTVLAIVAVVAVLFSLAPVRRVAPAIRRTDLGTMTNVMFETLEDRRLLAFVPPADPRVVTSLDSGWKFLRADAVNAQTVAFNDTSWSNVNVPHTWNAIDGQDGGNNYYRGIGWYRKHVTPDVSLAGKSLYLKFDGANPHDGPLYRRPARRPAQGRLLRVRLGRFIPALRRRRSRDRGEGHQRQRCERRAAHRRLHDVGGIYRHVNLIATNTEHAALQEFVPADTSGTPIGPTVSYWVNTPACT